MREFINIITEAQKPTKTASKTKNPEVDIQLPPTGNDVTPINPTKHSNVGKHGSSSSNLPGSTRSAAQARAASANLRMTPDVSNALSSIATSGMDDDISDEEAARNAGYHAHDIDTTDGIDEPVTPENLPAVISRELVRNDEDFNPKWTMVKHLPGYLMAPIRALGRQIFGQFTDTPIEDVQVLTTLTSPETDVRKMMAFISRHGIRDDDMKMDFGPVMPGVDADVKYYRMVGYDFLLVKDMMGYYIYAWPGGRGVHLGRDAEPKRLK